MSVVVAAMGWPDVQHFYHEPTGALSYAVSDPQTARAAVIEPVLDFSVVSGRTDTGLAQDIVDFIRDTL